MNIDIEVPEGLNPKLTALGWLVGRWEGTGNGSDHEGEGFEFEQRIEFSHNGGDYLFYASQTFLLGADGAAATPLGMEAGFWRPKADASLEVTLTNADNFSKFDAEDMSVMHEKGTKVLYQIDYAARAEEFADAAALDAYLDKVVVAVAANGMDGYSFTTDPLAADATARIIDRLATARTDGQLLVFEGNPLSLAATDRAKMDYVILDTEKLENVLDVRLHALHAVNYAGIEANRLLLTAEINAALFDEDRTEHAAVDEMSRRVVELGPYAGLAAYNIAEDYYHSEMNYQTIRQAIQTLNPSK